MTEKNETKPAPARRRIGLNAKIIGFFVMTIFATVAIVMYIGSSFAYQGAIKRLKSEAELLASIYGSNSGGAIRFGKTEILAADLARLFEKSDGQIGEIAVLGQDGSLVLAVPEGVEPSPETRALGEAAMASAGPVQSEDGLSAAAPAFFGPDRQVVGAVSMAWTPAEVAAELRSAAWWEALASAAVALAATLAAFLFLRGALFRPLRALGDAVSRALGGEAVEFPAQERPDSIGDLARSVAGIEAYAREMHAIRVALDCSAAAVAITDEELNVVYANPAMIKTLRDSESYWRERIPGFTPESLVGRNIDVFHKNPEHQRNRLRTLRERHRAEITFGGFVAGLEVVPIEDTQGARLGFMLQWTDRTAERRAEDQIAQVIEGARAGDFSKRVEVNAENAFLAAVANGINALGDNVTRFLQDIDQALSSLAAGDLTCAVEGSYDGQLGEIAERVTQTAHEMDRLVSRIIQVAGDISQTSTEISQGANELSSRAESEAASLEETAATMEEIAATVKTNAENAAHADGLASETRAQAERGREVIAETVQAMGNIRESASEIGEIVSTIDSIAFQTNLLALNAAVEAARAGDAGKGFAVVASEVRTLAQRSGEAAKTIKELIAKSTEHVATGDRLVGATDTALSEILDGVRNVAQTIEEIAGASREQSSGVTEVSVAVSQMDEMTQQNAAMADESAAAARSLIELSETLIERIRFFKTRDGAAGQASVTEEARARDRRAWQRDAAVESDGGREPIPAAPPPERKKAGNGSWKAY